MPKKGEFVRYLLKKTSVAAYDHPAKPVPSFKKCLRQRDYLQSGPIAKEYKTADARDVGIWEVTR